MIGPSVRPGFTEKCLRYTTEMAASSFMARLTRRWKRNSVDITEEDPTFKTVYLGNTVTQWAKGEQKLQGTRELVW